MNKYSSVGARSGLMLFSSLAFRNFRGCKLSPTRYPSVLGCQPTGKGCPLKDSLPDQFWAKQNIKQNSLQMPDWAKYTNMSLHNIVGDLMRLTTFLNHKSITKQHY